MLEIHFRYAEVDLDEVGRLFDKPFQAFCISGIIMTVTVIIARVFIRLRKQGRLFADDYALFVGVAIYIAMAALYIADLPYLYTFLDYTSGKVELDAEVVDAYASMMRFNFAVTSFFWAVLWSVKASLLLFFRRIIKWTDWMRAWWIIAIFTVLTFIGCIISEFTSCDSIQDFTMLGEATPNAVFDRADEAAILREMHLAPRNQSTDCQSILFIRCRCPHRNSRHVALP